MRTSPWASPSCCAWSALCAAADVDRWLDGADWARRIRDRFGEYDGLFADGDC
jgi:hypothetical protein